MVEISRIEPLTTSHASTNIISGKQKIAFLKAGLFLRSHFAIRSVQTNFYAFVLFDGGKDFGIMKLHPIALVAELSDFIEDLPDRILPINLHN
ncbi:MAG TPA: hypothetical protein DEB30_02315 [Candidatus Peribacter riflensis]|uniref:Uncharacterized protein n=1 Tax=Candidatus Peribacter riflensis TaxID=1735162 RepID=A0A0S1STA4_9BACT|nr:MAG: hypothetical protein PeribacterA2_0464 [Candidatus Peribacter riflensis]OGJ79273.1 MAG: hypothetical protein A2398_00460 [Candidatus Peribacteria bacterium RIFOXYB1_FULL_57_12]ALM10949.1 MAG: hypothetical protein PeribacterB2_0463 [Candidatus Peribacter riflensis]ALM12052.1 MAG: hypothetical protein PeribacterC2_0463 [Candidatus Peribacter riflensis]ALM13155.1 MAG: hypothetical protein PeribacterD1_0464 [Candidatus Peribacter riflensis]